MLVNRVRRKRIFFSAKTRPTKWTRVYIYTAMRRPSVKAFSTQGLLGLQTEAVQLYTYLSPTPGVRKVR